LVAGLRTAGISAPYVFEVSVVRVFETANWLK